MTSEAEKRVGRSYSRNLHFQDELSITLSLERETRGKIEGTLLKDFVKILGCSRRGKLRANEGVSDTE